MHSEFSSHPVHAAEYDTTSATLAGADLEMITEKLDDLLYPDMQQGFTISANRARVSSGVLFSAFRHEYLRTDVSTLGWSVEKVSLSIDHTQYLGRSALRQCYTVKHDVSLLQTILRETPLTIPPDNKVTTIAYFEQFSENATAHFKGSLLRPNIIGEHAPQDEPMTVYDCISYYRLLDEVTTIAAADIRESQAV